MPGISTAVSHVGDWPTVVYGVIWFVAYCIGNKDRWRRFLVLLPILVVLVMAWWLLADSSVLPLIHIHHRIPDQLGTGARP